MDSEQTITVSNGDLTLAFAPWIGGRLLSIRVGARELLWRNRDFLDQELRPRRPRLAWPKSDGTQASWINPGGSKSWPAPQGSEPGYWNGPPDEVLDSGRYCSVRADDESGTTMRMVSPPDPRSGLTVTRCFILPRSGTSFRSQIRFENSSDRTVRWSIWEVCQVDTGFQVGADRGEVLVDADLRHTGPPQPRVLDASIGRIRSIREDGRWRVPIEPVVGKLGFPLAAGRVRYVGPDGYGLSLQTEVDRTGVYPDGGCPIELWMQAPVERPIEGLGGLWPREYLIELELLSPLHTLAPGESSQLNLVWSVQIPRSRR